MSTGRVIRLLDRAPGKPPVNEIAGFAIDKDVPVPFGRGSNSRIRIAMDGLLVSESVLFPPPVKRGSINHIGRGLAPKQFTVSAVEGGLRCWRTA